MSPEISIITVAFNSEKTIERTIKSVLKQSYSNFEYIIIDGGSTDKTNEIIAQNISKFKSSVIHISEPDKGIYDAMNKGISLASGKLIGLLNSDDYYFEETLAIIHGAYENSDLKSVITGELIFKSGKREQLLKTSEKRFRKKMKQFKNGVRHPATYVPKLIYDEIGLFNIDFKIASDADLMFRIFNAKYSFVFLNETLVVMADEGISNSKGITNQILREKKFLLAAYCPNRLLRFYYMAVTKFRFLIKEFGAKLISAYRKIENN